MRSHSHVYNVHAKNSLKGACDVCACGTFSGMQCAIALFVVKMAINCSKLLVYDFSSWLMFIHTYLMLSYYQKLLNAKMPKCCINKILKRILKKWKLQNVRVRVWLDFGQNAHVHAMCVRPKLKCANVHVCDPKIHRNSHSAVFLLLWFWIFLRNENFYSFAKVSYFSHWVFHIWSK